MGDFAETSYVTEPQRRWIARRYGPDWDQPRMNVKSSGISYWRLGAEGLPLPVFEVKYNRAVAGIPAEHREFAIVRVVFDRDGDCSLDISYSVLETQREFNQRIAGYLHEWEAIKADYLEKKRLFDDGHDLEE
jgi:hypothetical protein